MKNGKIIKNITKKKIEKVTPRIVKGYITGNPPNQHKITQITIKIQKKIVI